MPFSRIRYIGFVHELCDGPNWKNHYYFDIVSYYIDPLNGHYTRSSSYATEFEAQAVRAVLIAQVKEYRRIETSE